MRRSVRSVAQSSAGVSVLEAVVALLLGVLLAASILSTLAQERVVVAALVRRAEILATARTVRVLLRREARAIGAGGWGGSTDSMSLRALRGTGTVCPEGRAGAVLRVSARGVRSPDPSKDSVMVVTSGGAVLVRALVDTEEGGGSCGPTDSGGRDRWTLSAPVPPRSVLVRYFERGSYHLSDGALRYKRGAAGRQPLTPETLLTPPSRFLPSGQALHLLLSPVYPPGAPSSELYVGGR